MAKLGPGLGADYAKKVGSTPQRQQELACPVRVRIKPTSLTYADPVDQNIGLNLARETSLSTVTRNNDG